MKTKSIFIALSFVCFFAAITFTSCSKEQNIKPNSKPAANPYVHEYILDGDTIGGSGGGFQIPVRK